ncbi:hypothetical protein Bca52824_063313 [Brassica carinata]|uniref:Uncharacterized protein n=1 Tax=Brassica carinata TaxID=52824 RepID=A0A8X7QIQ4_BRACI|nr:hypothetical protein Bca52824_063313 [Brassica carinata]
MNPLVTYEAYHNLMEICLRSGNPVSHYIEGIKLYFVQESTAMGLFTLRSLPKVSMKWDLSLCHPYVVHRKPSRGYGVLTFPWVGDKQVSS